MKNNPKPLPFEDLLKIVRVAMPNIIRNNVASVQPMATSNNKVFYPTFSVKYENNTIYDEPEYNQKSFDEFIKNIGKKELFD